MRPFVSLPTGLVSPVENGFVGIIWLVVSPSRELARTRGQKLWKTRNRDRVGGEVLTSDIMIPPLLVPGSYCEFARKSFVKRFIAPVDLG